MSLLYLTQQGTRLQKEHGRFLLSLPDRTNVAIPMTEVEQVMVFGNISLTTPTIAACLSRHIPVVFLSQSGTYRGHLWSADYDDHRAEAAQYACRDDLAFQWAVAQAIVRGKAWNSKQLLLKLNRRRQLDTVALAIRRIDRDLAAIDQLSATETGLDQLRGHEGAIAAHYFPALGELIANLNFSFTTRARRPPTDPVNALLSFGYMLLFNNVLSLLHLEGLNPYLGNLHRSDRHEAHLAFDLMEEFRSPIVDTLVLTLLNQQVFKPEDFLPPKANGAVYLDDTSRRRYLQAFEDRIMTTLHHPDAPDPVPYRRIIQLQIRRYKACLLDNAPYEPFRRET
ncbi:CRISPR-associated endonuclease Cas1 [Nodosilinea sp. P-1105]|uniref:CRISPR-associated endonuclease Cas1 n=1 Tax=Nodosilinea sp. P-1105 TaxID=2546229 RepID=UPI00146CE189|nr:CRISPR-associated endonuclease Cas1 [Nodosilinea sp. P-1105]NMF84113.1 CRISPR-associated endonuclease Cas1 [Nodosilinea sp. P-1105]